jgi:FeS assembly SUF system regulator
MLKITKLADYAVLIMYMLTQRQLTSASELARQTGIAEPTVSKVLKIFTKEKLARSQLGAHGGYSLAVAANRINLAQIISAVEGELAFVECDQRNSHSNCTIQASCKLRSNWQLISNAIGEVLATISLADMQQVIPK